MKPLTLLHSLPKISNLFPSFVVCAVSSWLLLKKLNYPLIGIDDANIYFVYARNLAGGYGFVYNIGGERVEGFTSLLWTSICAFIFKFFSHPEPILLAINVIIVSFGIAYAMDHVQRTFSAGKVKWGHPYLWSALYLVIIYSSARYVAWNTFTLMENALWSTFLLLTTIVVIREDLSPSLIHFRFAPLAVLLLLTRPESYLWIAIFVGILILRLALQSTLLESLRVIAPVLVVITATFAFLTMFRLYYFGYLFPNTFYAKVSPLFAYNVQEGLIYLLKYSVSDPIVTFCVIAVIFAVFHTLQVLLRQPRDGKYLFLPIIAATGLLFPLLVGGDHFGAFRVYQNVYPIAVLNLFIFLHHVLSEHFGASKYLQAPFWTTKFYRLLPSLIITSVLLQSQWYTWNSIDSEIGVEFRFADYGRKNGTFIQNAFSILPELPSLGVVTSGGIKYSYSGEVIDLLGLNNTIMAHNQGNRVGIKDHAAFDIPTFYKLEPDIVSPFTVDEANWQYSEAELKESWENTSGLKGLYDDAQFQESYTYAKVSSETETKYAIVGWFKNDFLKLLKENGGFRVEEYRYDQEA